MTTALTDSFLTALNAAGIPAYPEYPQILKPLPTAPFFVTVACTAMDFDAPLQSAFGDVMPLSLTLRLRLHCRTDAAFTDYAEQVDVCILQTAQQNQLDLRRMRFGELHYVRQIDRLVRETLLDICGTGCDFNREVLQ